MNLVKKIFGYFDYKKKLEKYNLKTNLGDLVKDKTIVFSCLKESELYFAVYGMFCSFFKKAGAKEVYMLLDDGIYNHWDSLRCSMLKNNDWDMTLKKVKTFNNMQTLKHKIFKKIYKKVYTFKVLHASDIVKDVVLKASDKEKCDLEKYAINSCRRFFETPVLDVLGNSKHKKYYEYSYTNAELSLKIAKYIRTKIKADFTFLFDGMYAMDGVVYETLKNYGENVFVLDGTCKNKDFKVHLDTHPFMLTYNHSKLWKEFLAERKNFVNKRDISKQFFLDRINKKGEHKMYFLRDDTLSTDIDFSQKPVFLLFTNVLWDGNIPSRDVIFENIISWLKETVLFFYENPDKGQLIVRFHPAEATLYDQSLKLSEIIMHKLKPEILNANNIHFVSSDLFVNSYDLIKKSDICLAYDNTTAQEAVFLETPVILAGKGANSGKGFAFEPKTKPDYFEMLTNPSRILNDFDNNRDLFYGNLLDTTYFNLEYSPILIPIFEYTLKGDNQLIFKFDNVNDDTLIEAEKQLNFVLSKLLR